MNNIKKLSDGIVGLSIGDAFGVPYEFKLRSKVKDIIQEDFVGDIGGINNKGWTWNQPPGTWSDDTSLTLCLADSLLNGYDLNDIAEKFISWKEDKIWTARGEVFDIGNLTKNSIDRLKRILLRDISLEEKEKILKNIKKIYGVNDNGNGSLMRILPLISIIKGKDLDNQFDIIEEVSALTHGHIRSVTACFIYLKLVENILDGKDKFFAYEKTKEDIDIFLKEKLYLKGEYGKFKRILNSNINNLDEKAIKSTSYVIDTLEAAIWSFLNSESYKESIMLSTSLGNDTDTISAITGSLTGIYYGIDSIPENWKNKLARFDDIKILGEKLDKLI